MNKDKNILNKTEKKEIMTDVKAAFEKAKKSPNINYKNIQNQKKPKIVIFITIIIIIIISSAGIYWYLANNPKTIFIRSVDSVFETLADNIKIGNQERLSKIVDINYQLNPAEKYENLNNYNFKIYYNENPVNNKK